MHILPYDYVADRPSETVGLARTATLIRQARAEAANCLLFDNGDFLHGTPASDELVRADREGEVDSARTGLHPMIAAMAQLGYDAITLGNHEFDHGVGYLASVLVGAPFPILTSNLSLRPAAMPVPGMLGGPAPVPLPAPVPFALIERHLLDRGGQPHLLRIGLIGLLPPRSITGLGAGPFRAEIRDMVAATRSIVPHLRAMGADLVVLLAHTGIGAEALTEDMENAVVPLAGINGVDAVISGHAHQVFPGPGPGGAPWPAAIDAATGRIHGTPVVAPGFWGSHLGIIDLEVVRRPAGGWRVRAGRAEARPIAISDGAGPPRALVAPDPEIGRMMTRLHDFTLSRVRRPVGETRRVLHSYFAAVAPSAALDIVHRAKLHHVAAQVADSALAELPIVVSTAPFKAGGLAGPAFYTHVAPGPITLKSLSDLYLYPNDVVVLRLTGAELVDWLERAASVFNRLAPGVLEQPLMSGSAPAYAFEVVAGVDYEIDLSRPGRFTPEGRRLGRGGDRVQGLRLADGRPLAPESELLFVTNSFRRSGGGAYPLPAREPLALHIPVRDALMDYLAETGPYDGTPVENWRFAALPGTEAQFVSAPGAEMFLGEVGSRAIRAGAIDGRGFRQFTLRL